MVARPPRRPVAVAAVALLAAAVLGAVAVGAGGSAIAQDASNVSEADAPADSGGGLFWYGQRLSVRDDAAPGAEYQLRVVTDAGPDPTDPVTEFTLDETGAGVVPTSSIAPGQLPGEFVIADGEGRPLVVEDGVVAGRATGLDAAAFEVARQSVSFDLSPSPVEAEGAVTASIDSNRGRYAAIVTAENTTDDELVGFFAPFDATDVDVDGDGNVSDDDGVRVEVRSTQARRTLAAEDLGPGRHDPVLDVVDAVASTSATVEREPFERSVVRFEEQPSGGERVTVEVVVLPTPGFVAVHDASLRDGAVFGSVVGHSRALPAGETRNVSIPLDADPGGTRSLTVRLYRDTNRNGEFDFVESSGDADSPVLTRNGTAVVADSARIRFGGAPPAVVGDTPPRDLDGDGRFEDVNGDGALTPGDATALFEAVFRNDPAVTEHPDAFDVNGDGALTPGDATALFRASL